MNQEKPLESVAVIGLGKLGAPIVACFASKGYQVVGCDVNAKTIEAINEGRAPVYEPGLPELLLANRERIRATPDVSEAVRQTPISFIIVPTPSEKDGGFSLDFVLPACEQIGRGLRERNDYHLVVLTSTVLPGATGGPVLELLEKSSGKRCGEGFGLCYSPEFIALGSVIRDVLNPDFILIGQSDERAGKMLEAFQRTTTDNAPPIVRMNLVNAEVTKLSVNTFVTTKIAFANMIARLCERMPGADADVVTGALGLDSRIGGKYLKGAVGYGGPCFPRDNQALAALARRVEAPATLAEATDAANRREAQLLAVRVQGELPPGGTVGILGLAYKPDTDVSTESQGVLLAQALHRAGVPVVAYDPAAMPTARRLIEAATGDAAAGTAAAGTAEPVRYAESARQCVAQSDAVVVITPWREFRDLSAQDFARPGAPRVLFDCWRSFNPDEFKSVVRYIALGRGPQPQPQPQAAS